MIEEDEQVTSHPAASLAQSLAVSHLSRQRRNRIEIALQSGNQQQPLKG